MDLKRLLSVCFWLGSIFLCPPQLHAQTNKQNLEKYWKYRERLVSDFLVIGPDAGQSIPAGIRNLYNGGALHFGDAPVYLGYYLGVLATEYRLLQENGQSTDASLTELYYALEAINRLDVKAEFYWGKPNLNGEKNGFLIESDVPSDFCTRYMKQLNKTAGSGFIVPGSGISGKVNQVLGGLDSIHPRNSTCSQDHLACLLMGLSLTCRFASDSLTFFDYLLHAKRTYSFVQSAKGIAGRILSYMRDHPFGGRSWRLYMPDKTRIAQDNGGNALFNAYGFALAGSYLSGKNYRNTQTTLTHFYWKSIYSLPAFPRLNTDNLLFGLELSAIGDSWRGNAKLSKTARRINKTGQYEASPIFHLWKENHYGWNLFYGSIFHLLHDSVWIPDLKGMEKILNGAPAEGPFYHGGNDAAPNGWAASSLRFYDSPPNQDTGKKDFTGNYNGLDYMLFFNLYCLSTQVNAMVKGADSLSYRMTDAFTHTR
jgi:hypothetical protein